MEKLKTWFNYKLLYHYTKLYWDGKYCKNCGKKVRGRFGLFCSNKCFYKINPSDDGESRREGWI